MSDRQKAEQGWDKLLDPRRLRANLHTTSIYLTTYELLLQALVEQLRSFFMPAGANEDGDTKAEYKRHVLDLHDMPYLASAIWHRSMGALNEEDVEKLREIRGHRNFVAHNIPSIIMDTDHDVRQDLLREIARLVAKIDRWWIREVHLTTTANMTGAGIDAVPDGEIASLRMLVIDMLLDVALANGDQLATIYAALQRAGPPGEA